jgi:hypothetical protein
VCQEGGDTDLYISLVDAAEEAISLPTLDIREEVDGFATRVECNSKR